MFKVLTDEISLDGVFRDAADILNPTISVQTSENISSYNFAYIEEFGRYYFINDLNVSPNSIWNISCSVDVLFTYRNQLQSVTARFSRIGDIKWTTPYCNDNNPPNSTSYWFHRHYWNALAHGDPNNKFVDRFILTIAGKRE